MPPQTSPHHPTCTRGVSSPMIRCGGRRPTHLPTSEVELVCHSFMCVLLIGSHCHAAGAPPPSPSLPLPVAAYVSYITFAHTHWSCGRFPVCIAIHWYVRLLQYLPLYAFCLPLALECSKFLETHSFPSTSLFVCCSIHLSLLLSILLR